MGDGWRDRCVSSGRASLDHWVRRLVRQNLHSVLFWRDKRFVKTHEIIFPINQNHSVPTTMQNAPEMRSMNIHIHSGAVFGSGASQLRNRG